jgi:HSP20 family protein
MLSRFFETRTGDPFFALESLHREMSRALWDEDFGATATRKPPQAALEIEDVDDAFILTLPLPGATEKDVSLTVLGDTVELRADRKVEAPEGYTVRHRERSSLSFARKFRLAAPLEAEAASAELKHGVLTVTLPKAKKARPQKVAVVTK